MSDIVLNQVKNMARQLSESERTQLLEWLATASHEQDVRSSSEPSRSLYGLWADLGDGPTDEDIDEIRREMWAAFPREDIA